MSKVNQISRLAAPESWPIVRKGSKWVAKPYPGAHSLHFSMALNTWLLEVMQLANIRKNVKRIITAKEVFVNGKQVRISVLDQQGRVVQGFQGRPDQGKGFSATWRPGGLPSGVYVLRAETGTETLVKKAVLLH